MKKQVWAQFRRFGTSPRLFNKGDRLVVDVNKADSADTGDFFKYRTGRWLVNDKEQRDARTTKFNMKGLADIIRENATVTDKTAEIDTIEPWFEGKHNKLYKVALQDNRTYVLRIPYATVGDEYRKMRLLSEVATMKYVKENTKVKVPSVLSYSGVKDNGMETPYILMDYVNGTKMAERWNPASPEAEVRDSVIKPVAKMVSEIVQNKFNTIGSLYLAEDIPNADGKYETVADGKFVVGPSTEKIFWRSDLAKEFRGPWKTTEEYIQATANAQLAYTSAPGVSAEAKVAAERYQKIVGPLLSSEEVSKTGGIRLNVPDIGPLNIIEQEDDAFWLIDFENSSVKPYVLHGLPWFVRCPHERIFSEADIPSYDKLNDQQKRIVQHIIILTQCELAFEKTIINEHKGVLDAHNPKYKRREEAVRTAMSTDMDNEGFYNDVDFAVYKLVQLWPILSLSGDCPIQYSDKDLAKLETSVSEWNQYLMKNPTVENKHFLGSREFDQLLGQGFIEPVPDKPGNYRLTDKFTESAN